MDYPYYIIPDIEALPTAEGAERDRIISRISMLIGDRAALRRILNIEEPEEETPVEPALSTSDAIDSFINRYGKPDMSQSPEAKKVEELVPLPPPDYDLSQIETDPIVTQEEENITPGTENKPAAITPDFSESLARAMIKNGNYVKALEIITDLSLNNPKKSIYFADQIRFLKKLILNQSKSKNV
ncbi:MAG: hypothetical protein K2J23_05795 [Muribaculaceae bacterium]|nr:hypothetical protein [Muribaculaceae bacterium]